MHELGVVFHIADIVRDVAVENKATKVQKVVMQIGEVSTVVNDQLIDCWNWNANRTELLKGCVLEIEPVKAVTYCEDCKKEYETVKYGKICPYCKAKGLIFEGQRSHDKRNRRGISGENQKTIG